MKLGVYDLGGRLIRPIYSGIQQKGYYSFLFSNDDLDFSGIYFIRFEAGEVKKTLKVKLIK